MDDNVSTPDEEQVSYPEEGYEDQASYPDQGSEEQVCYPGDGYNDPSAQVSELTPEAQEELDRMELDYRNSQPLSPLQLKLMRERSRLMYEGHPGSNEDQGH